MLLEKNPLKKKERWVKMKLAKLPKCTKTKKEVIGLQS